MPVPSQEGINPRTNVTVNVDAVVYFISRWTDPLRVHRHQRA